MYRAARPPYAMASEPSAPPARNAMRNHQGDFWSRRFSNYVGKHEDNDPSAPRNRGPGGGGINGRINGSGGGSGAHWKRNWNRQHQNQNENQPPPPSRLAQPPISSLDLGLRPRPLADLVDERALLLDELQRHDADVRDLFARLAAADERWAPPSHGYGGGGRGPEYEHEGRRQRGILGRRVELAVDREREILARMGELSVEIQCCERWWQVKRGREPVFVEPMRPAPGDGSGHLVDSFPPPSSLPCHIPSPLGLPPWPPGPVFASPCECEQCTGILRCQGTLPPPRAGDVFDPDRASPRPYRSDGPVPSRSLNDVWKPDGRAEYSSPHQDIPRQTSPKLPTSLEENIMVSTPRRKSLP